MGAGAAAGAAAAVVVVEPPISSVPQMPHLWPGVALWRTSSILRGVAVQRDLVGSISPPRWKVEVASRSPGWTYEAVARGRGEIWTWEGLEGVGGDGWRGN